MKKFNLKVLLILAMGHLVVDIYQGALPALLPFLKAKLALTYTTAGMLLMVSNISSSVMQPLFGYYSDKKAFPVLLPLGLVCASAGLSLLPVTPHYAFLLVLVAISGLGIAAYHPEGYKTASFFTGERIATGMSIFSVGGSFGYALGPMLTMLIITWLGFSFLPVIGIPAIIAIFIILSQKKTIAIPALEQAHRSAGPSVTQKGAYSALAMIILVVIIRTWTQLGIVTYIPFYYIDYLKGNPLFTGNLIFVYLLCGAAGTFFGGPLADKLGNVFLLRISMLLAALMLPLIFLPFVQHTTWLLFVVLGLMGAILLATFGTTVVMAQRLLPHKLGIASGLMTGFAIGTGGIGVTLLGLIADRYGVPTAMKSIAILPVAGFILSLFVRYDKEAQI